MSRPLQIALAALAAIVLAVAAIAFGANALIYRPHPEQVAPNFPGTQAVRIATEDGESLIAWYRAPQPSQPIFLFLDGNGGRPQIWGGRWRRIAESGAGFLAVCYRGYSGSTGRPSEAGLHLDARAGYGWLIANNYTPRDIVIHGFSLGSGPAVRLATEHAARALILEAPFTGVDDVAAAHYTDAARFLIRDTYRTRDWIGDVHMPVLIVHGDADTVIPFTQGERLFALANQPKQFVRMQGSDHATLVRDGIYPTSRPSSLPTLRPNRLFRFALRSAQLEPPARRDNHG
ncbi:MAG: alpha/beta hydrolase [Vitreimonas sp.]